MIDLFRPYVPPSAADAVSNVLRSRWIGQGPKVDQFEKKFSSFFEQKYSVALNSGTAALETAYDIVDIQPGDEVITTPLTCTATNIPLLRRGAKIVWADILPSTLCIDPDDVIDKLTSKTKAVVQVHLGGIPARCYEDELFMDGKSIPVISDAAQALGIFKGDYTCCSFQAIKQLTTADGGMFICQKEEDFHKAKLLRWFGIDRERKIANQWQAYKERKMTFDIELPGCKRHMNDIAAAMGLCGLEDYIACQYYRQELFTLYLNKLHDVSGITVVHDPDAENMCWLCTVLVEDRDNFAKMMFEAGIDTNVVQVRNDIYKIFGGQRADLPIMNAVEHQYLSLPIGMHVTVEDIDYICDCIRKGW